MRILMNQNIWKIHLFLGSRRSLNIYINAGFLPHCASLPAIYANLSRVWKKTRKITFFQIDHFRLTSRTTCLFEKPKGKSTFLPLGVGLNVFGWKTQQAASQGFSRTGRISKNARNVFLIQEKLITHSMSK